MKSKIPYTVLVIHYEETVSEEEIKNVISDLENQTYKEFEVLFIHDGPRKKDYPLEGTLLDYKIIDMARRYNDWGHSLRDLGIKRAKGKHIVILNADNRLYPNALEEITKIRDNKSLDIVLNSEIIVFPIYLMNTLYTGLRMGKMKDVKMLLSGRPPKLYYIDCMQAVISKKAWLSYGGWKDKSECSDGRIYEEIIINNGGARYGTEVLGEHW